MAQGKRSGSRAGDATADRREPADDGSTNETHARRWSRSGGRRRARQRRNHLTNPPHSTYKFPISTCVWLCVLQHADTMCVSQHTHTHTRTSPWVHADWVRMSRLVSSTSIYIVARSDTALCQKSDRNNIGENKSSSAPGVAALSTLVCHQAENGSAGACRNGRAQVRFGASRPRRRPAGGSCPSALIYNAPRSAAAPRAPVVDLRRPVSAGRRTRLRHALRRLHVRGYCKFPESE